jgi:hypothetical protein
MAQIVKSSLRPSLGARVLDALGEPRRRISSARRWSRSRQAGRSWRRARRRLGGDPPPAAASGSPSPYSPWSRRSFPSRFTRWQSRGSARCAAWRAIMRPAGVEKGVGITSAAFAKDIFDPRWKDDASIKEWLAFMTKYMPDADIADPFNGAGHTIGATLVHVLTQCTTDLSRENIMRQAANIKDLELPASASGHKGQHLARQFLPHQANAARPFQRRELAAVRRPDKILSRRVRCFCRCVGFSEELRFPSIWWSCPAPTK